jgi:hypothetical protein
MKTIIKIPLYVEIESEDGGDRKQITEAVRSLLQPELLYVIQSSEYSIARYFRASQMREFSKQLGKGSRFRFISEFEILKSGIKDSNHQINVEKKPWDL